jgi:hypothetical protein
VTANECVVCGRPTPDGWCCTTETERARQQLAEIGDLVEAARAVAYRQTSTGDGGRSTPGPRDLLDYGAGARLDAVQTALTGWARVVAEERGQGVEAGDQDLIVVAAGLLSQNLEWLRHVPWVDEVLREVGDCVHAMRAIVERGREPNEIVGACECERILYAKAGRSAVTCPDCAVVWDVSEARDELRGRLNGKLVTAAEAAHLGAYLDTDRTSEQVRKLVNKWASRGRIEEQGTSGADPTYRFGDIAEMIAESPRRAVQVTTA